MAFGGNKRLHLCYRERSWFESGFRFGPGNSASETCLSCYEMVEFLMDILVLNITVVVSSSVFPSSSSYPKYEHKTWLIVVWCRAFLAHHWCPTEWYNHRWRRVVQKHKLNFGWDHCSSPWMCKSKRWSSSSSYERLQEATTDARKYLTLTHNMCWWRIHQQIWVPPLSSLFTCTSCRTEFIVNGVGLPGLPRMKNTCKLFFYDRKQTAA